MSDYTSTYCPEPRCHMVLREDQDYCDRHLAVEPPAVISASHSERIAAELARERGEGFSFFGLHSDDAEALMKDAELLGVGYIQVTREESRQWVDGQLQGTARYTAKRIDAASVILREDLGEPIESRT